MAEIEIKRVNFFQGQYLQEADFTALTNYIVHMRRRLLYALFAQSGVVQLRPDGADLKVEIADVARKTVRVRAGMAIGRQDNSREGKEIILREDIPEINLALRSDFVQQPLQSGDTAVITVQYADQKVANPPDEGDPTQNTRILEQAVVRVFRNSAPTPGDDEDPYVVLANVDFDTMTIKPGPPKPALISATLIEKVPSIRITPNQVTAGRDGVALTVASLGTLNLAGVIDGQVTIRPPDDITNVHVASAQADRLTLTFNVAAKATGDRVVQVSLGGVAFSDTLSLLPGVTVTGFAGVDQPAGNILFKIRGTGFQAPATVEFSTGSGNFTQPFLVTAGSITATEIPVPLNHVPDEATKGIPDEATKGPVRVTSNGQTRTSPSDVVPPAVITQFTPNPVRRGATNFVITGKRFFADTIVTLGGKVANITQRSDDGTSLTVTVSQQADTDPAQPVRIETGGGKIQSKSLLTINA